MLDLYIAGLPLVFHPFTLLMMALGVFAGIVIGALPGLSAVMGVAILVPMTYGLNAESGILMLIGVYIGAVYGGSISATLINIPGTSSAVMTTLDAYPMAKKGQAGRALGMATSASFIGGVFSVFVLMFASPLIASVALRFTSIEMFFITLMGIAMMAYIAEGSLLKGLMSGVIGLLLATVGADPMTSYLRYDLGVLELSTGVEFIPAMIGLFGLTEMILQCFKKQEKATIIQKIDKVLPSLADLKSTFFIMMRSSVIGVIVGAIPGTGATIAAIVAYGQEKRLSKHPERLGTGCIEGIAAAESSNNACTGGAMTTLISLGIPGDSVTAILIGAFMVHGLRPGPTLFQENFQLVSAIFIGLLVANVFMLILGLLCCRMFAKILSIPPALLSAAIVSLCFIGAFAVRNSYFDMCQMFFFGLFGVALSKCGIPRTPLVLGLILGPLAESNLRRSITLYGMGSEFLGAILKSPIAIIVLVITIVILLFPLFQKNNKHVGSEV